MSNSRSKHASTEEWDLVINAEAPWFDLKINEIVKYKDLLYTFVKRDFISVYKQTILGPLWFFIQPILTTVVFTVIFGGIANISTNGIPAPLFYLSGITLWNYFSDCLTKTSDVFNSNSHIFGKVYFPRLIVPVAVIFSSLLKLIVQLVLFSAIWLYYSFSTSYQINIDLQPELLLLIPVLVIIIAIMGLGMGIIFTAFTTKYRDLRFLIQFGIQLLMYASPIVYPMSNAHGKLKTVLMLNPVSSIIEAFKYITMGVGEFSFIWLGYSALFSIVVCTIGILLFNKVEKSFLDVI